VNKRTICAGSGKIPATLRACGAFRVLRRRQLTAILPRRAIPLGIMGE
jgi:hypothetical protein